MIKIIFNAYIDNKFRKYINASMQNHRIAQKYYDLISHLQMEIKYIKG